MNNLHKSGYSSQDSYDLDIEKKDMLGQIEKLDKRTSVKRDRHASMLVDGSGMGALKSKTKYLDEDPSFKNKMRGS